MRFLNPYYLFGLMLIAVPIIIHLYFRKKLKKIPFSSLVFLKSAEASRLRWLRLREILILFARCLFVASLFLALARPQYQGRLVTGNKLASVYLIIDNSFSMGYGRNFEIALEQAERIIDTYSPKSMFYVIPMCGQKGFKPFWCNKHSATKNLKELKLSNSTGELKDLYDKFIQEKTDLPKELVYIGDGQTINFRGIEKLTDFYWLRIPLGSNVTIEYVLLKNPFSAPEQNTEMIANVKNYSNHSYQGKVQISAGHYFNQQECDIPPGQDYQLSFSLPIAIQKGVVQIENDSLPIDNQYYFSKSILTRMRVLIAGNDKYIRLGLSPSKTVKSQFEIENAATLKSIDLRPFEVIILNGIDEITEFEYLKLTNFLAQPRNGLIIFLTPKIGRQLRNLIADCCDIMDWINIDGYLNIKSYDMDFQPFEIFKDNPGLKTIKFFKFSHLNPRGKVLAKLDNGMPLIINHKNIMVIATEINENNTDIMYNPNFLPLLHSLIYGLTNRNIDNEFKIGQKILRTGLIKGPDGEILSEGIFLRPGFHTSDGETLGVNIDPIESNSTTITPEMAKNLGIRTITIESLSGPADLTTFFLILTLCAFVCEILFLLL
ncbi:MAG: BatA domain-containing protein [candidate division WOR-3 bacterium]